MNKKYNSFSQIKTFTVISESVGEDNFSSQIFRMQIEFSCKYSKDAVKNVVVKILANKSSDNVLADEAVFDTELKMYSSVLPKMEHSLEIGGEKVKIAPRLVSRVRDKKCLPIFDMFPTNSKSIVSNFEKFQCLEDFRQRNWDYIIRQNNHVYLHLKY